MCLNISIVELLVVGSSGIIWVRCGGLSRRGDFPPGPRSPLLPLPPISLLPLLEELPCSRALRRPRGFAGWEGTANPERGSHWVMGSCIPVARERGKHMYPALRLNRKLSDNLVLPGVLHLGHIHMLSLALIKQMMSSARCLGGKYRILTSVCLARVSSNVINLRASMI